jgi:hypothetical protein
MSLRWISVYILLLTGNVYAQENATIKGKADKDTVEDRLEQLEKELGRVKRQLKREKEAREKDIEDQEVNGILEEAEKEASEGENELNLNSIMGFVNQQRLNAFNPRFTVISDFIGRGAAKSNELAEDDRFSLREVELDLRAAVDPYANGVAILAIEEEDGEYIVDVEEAYVTLETLPWNLRIKMGRYRVGFGNINKLHTHDLPWTPRPQPLLDFLGEEGLVESGALLSWISPSLGPLTVTVEGNVLNGENETILAGQDSDEPSYLGRTEAFVEINNLTFLTLGGNLLYGHNSRGTSRRTLLSGADLIFKYQPNASTSFALISEVYFLDREVPDSRREHAFGGFGAAQFQFLQNFYVGARADYSNYDQQVENSRQTGAAAYFSYYTTEYLRFRVGYEHRWRETTSGVRQPNLGTLFLQITFVFGSHPVEPFWYSK